jgi:hypothetical protein
MDFCGGYAPKIHTKYTCKCPVTTLAAQHSQRLTSQKQASLPNIAQQLSALESISTPVLLDARYRDASRHYCKIGKNRHRRLGVSCV